MSTANMQVLIIWLIMTATQLIVLFATESTLVEYIALVGTSTFIFICISTVVFIANKKAERDVEDFKEYLDNLFKDE